MTRNAASKCNNKYLSVLKSCVRENYANPTVGLRGQGWSQENILCLGSRWKSAAMLRSKL